MHRADGSMDALTIGNVTFREAHAITSAEVKAMDEFVEDVWGALGASLYEYDEVEVERCGECGKPLGTWDERLTLARHSFEDDGGRVITEYAQCKCCALVDMFVEAVSREV